MLEGKIYEHFKEEEFNNEYAVRVANTAIDSMNAIFGIIDRNELFGLWDMLGHLPERTRKEDLLYEALGPLVTLQTIHRNQNSAQDIVGRAIFGPDFDLNDEYEYEL